MTAYTLTSDQRSTFERDGVLCLRGVLSTNNISALRSVVDEQIAGLSQSKTAYDFESIARQLWSRNNRLDVGQAERFDVDHLAAAILADDEARPLLEDSPVDEDGMFLYEIAGWKHHRGIRQVAFDSALPALVADLLGANVLNFWEDTTFVKAPHTRQKTAFHQDLAYFQIEGDQCVIVWIALDPADEHNGVTRYVRGSHKWGEIYAPNMFVSQTLMPGSPHGKCPDIEASEADYDIVSFDVQPGDVIIHHVLTVHGAGGNPSEKPRRAISFRYCGDQVRYFDRPGAIPQPGIVSPLQTGDRLYSRDYPVVWPKPWPEANLADLYELSFQGETEAA